MADPKNNLDGERAGVELARLVLRLEGLKEDKKEAVADWTAQIKTCEKEIRRLAVILQQQQQLFAGKA